MRAEVIGQTLNLHRDLLRVAVCQIWVNFLFCIFTLVESCIYTFIVCRGFQYRGERWATPLGQLLEDIDQWAQLFIPSAYVIAMWAIFGATLMNLQSYTEEDGTLQLHIVGAGARALELGSQAVIAPTLATLALVSGTMIVEPSTGDLITRD